jgi:hypothetical protein
MAHSRLPAEKIDNNAACTLEILKELDNLIEGKLGPHCLPHFGNPTVNAVALASIGHGKLNDFDKGQRHVLIL